MTQAESYSHMLAATSDAMVFAAAAHRDQTRKYTGEPYLFHCAEVAGMLGGLGCCLDTVKAAWLHDVLEDCDVKYEQLVAEFGTHVANLVWWVTNQSKPEDGNRATRKAIDCQHLAAAPAEAQTIKLADLISNTSSIVEHDPGFAKVYLKEKRELLEVLTRGHPRLHAEATKILEQAEKELGQC